MERDRVKKERDEALRTYQLFQEQHVERSMYQDLTDTYHRLQGELYAANHKLALAEERARKTGTNNENTKIADTLELAVQLLEIACKGKTEKGRMQLYNSKAWSKVTDLVLHRALYRRFADCVYGPDLPPKKTHGGGES